MLENVDISRLVAPVIQRASADFSARIQGFSDRSAAFVLQQLGLSSQTQATTRSEDRQCESIARCAWIDRQLLNFFNQHPKGEAVEVANGLSTRFHRLCEQADWPQFSWWAINSFDIDEYLARVFPAMDNHRCIGADFPQENWENVINWHSAPPKIIVIGEYTPLQQASEFSDLYDRVQKVLTSQTPVVDVILIHSIANFFSWCCSENLAVEFLSEQPARDKKSGVKNIFVAFGRRRSQEKNVTAHHLRLIKKSMSKRG